MESFWKNQQVLVTGGAGFIGSWLCHELVLRGARVIVLDEKKTFPFLGERENALFSKATYIQGDVRDEELVAHLFDTYSPLVVFHLAARAIVEEALENPKECLDTNVRGTWNIVEIFREKRKDQAKIVVASSDKAYGAHEALPYNETYPLRGDGHPYDCSKGVADTIAQMYARVYALPICITRCGNVYGGGDPHLSRLIPSAIRSLLKDERVKIRSDGTFRRDYIYVEDVVSGYLHTAEAMKDKSIHGEAFNFGNNTPLSVLEVVEHITRRMGKEHLKPHILNNAKNEIVHQYLDAAKAMNMLGWKPRYSFEKGIEETIEWYKRNLNF